MENCYVNIWRHTDAVNRRFGLAASTLNETVEAATVEVASIGSNLAYVRTIWIHDDHAALLDLTAEAALLQRVRDLRARARR